jgi:predicted MFS family arabinose efflux permease
VIDDQMSRASIIDAAGRLSGVIENSPGTLQISIGLAARTDGRYVYITNNTSLGETTAIGSESILKYDLRGNLLDTVAVINWPEDDLHSAPGILDFYFDDDGNMKIVVADDEKIELCSVGKNRNIICDQKLTFPDGGAYRCSYSEQKNCLVICTIAGEIFTYDGSALKKVYAYDGRHQMNCAVMGNDGQIYASDPNDASVFVLGENGNPEQRVSDVDCAFLSAGDGRIYFSDEITRVFQSVDLSDAGVTVLSGVPFSAGFIFRYMVITLAYIWLAAGMLFYLIRWQTARRRKRRHEEKQSEFTMNKAIVFMLVAASIVMCSFIVYYTNEKRTDAAADEMRIAGFLSQNSGKTFGSILARAANQENISDKDYFSIRNYLDDFWNASARNGISCYYFLELLHGDELYVFADSTGHYQPGTAFEPVSGNEEKEKVVFGKEVVHGGNHGTWNSYDYAVAPISDSSGTVVGVIEIGTYAQTFGRKQVRNIVSIILMGLTFLMGSIIFMDEFYKTKTALCRMREENSKERMQDLIRPLSFFYFLSISLDKLLIIIILKNLLTEDGSAKSGIMPYVFMAGISAIGFLGVPVGRALLKKYHISRLLQVLFTVVAISSIFAGTALILHSLALYLFSECLFSLAQDTVFTVFRFMPTIYEDEKNRHRMFGSISGARSVVFVLGSALGGYLAQFLGYQAVYFAAAAVLIMPIVVSVTAIGDIGMVDHKIAGKEGSARISDLVRFLLSPKGALPILLTMLMVLATAGYRMYLFPVYSQSLGYDLISVSNVVVIATAIAVIFEDFNQAVTEKIGQAKAYFYIMFSMAGIMIFSVYNASYGWSIFFVIFSLATSEICVSFEGGFLLDRAAKMNVPEPMCLSIRQGADSTVRVISPVLFGWMLTSAHAYSFACLFMAAALIVSGLLFSVLTRRQ